MASNATISRCQGVGRQLTDTFVDSYFMNYIVALAARAVPYIQTSQYCSNSHNMLIPTRNPLPTLDLFVRILVLELRLPRVVLIASAVYLGRWGLRYPGASGIISSASHRLVLTSMVIAVKHLYDDPPSNTRWVRYLQKINIHYFTIKHINCMEREMLSDLRWEVQISPADVRKVSEPVLFVLGKELLDFAQL